MSNDRMPEVPATSPAEVEERQAAAGAAGVAPPPRYVSNEELAHRFTYHAPSGKARELHDDVRREMRWVAQYLNDLLPEGRSKSLTLTALEETSFHAHAAIAREPALHDHAETNAEA